MGEIDPQELRQLQNQINELRRRLVDIEHNLKMVDSPVPPPLPPAESELRPTQPAEPPGEEPQPEPPPSTQAAETPVQQTGPPRYDQPEPPPPAQAAETSPRPARRGLSLEQRVGTSWLVKIGVVVLFLAAVFFFQYSVQQGWINETVRVYCVAGFGLLLLVAGEWALRKAMGMFAAGVTGGGIAMLYAAAFAASPNFYDLVPTPVAFALMCGVTVVAIALSLRSGMISTAILAQIGAYLTPLLLSTGVDKQVALMTYMVVLAAGFQVVAAAKRWQALAPISLVGTAALFAGWMVQFYGDAALARTMAFAWAMLGVFVAYAAVATRLDRAHDRMGIAITAVGGALLAALLVVVTEPLMLTSVAMTHLLALNVIVLGVCLFRGWQWLRLGVLAWTALIFVSCFEGGGVWSDVWWGWALFALFTAEVAARRLLDRVDGEELEIGLTASVGALLVALMLTLDGGLAILPHLLALNAAVLGMCLWRGWQRLRIGVLVWTVWAFVAAMGYRAVGSEVWWGWALFALFMADVTARRLLDRSDERTGIGLTASAGALLAALLLFVDDGWLLLPHLFALDVVVLGMCMWRRWNWLRTGVLAWTAVCFAALVTLESVRSALFTEELFYSMWAWLLFGLLTADVLIRAWLLRRRNAEKLDMTLATLTTAAMYGATYWLLKDVWSDAAMAWYTGSLGAGLIVLSIVLRAVARQRRLGMAYLGQGLVLLALAVPIAFDRWAVTVVWSVNAVIAMLLASRLKEKLLLVKSVVLVYLAGMHFINVDLQEFGSAVLVTVGGLSVTVALSLAATVAAAAVISAALLRLGEVISQDRGERTLCVALVCAGAVLWFWQAVQQLPMVPTTWAWWLFAAGVAAVALWRRGPAMATIACVLLALCVGRFMLHDTLEMRAHGPADTARIVVFNWQFGVGVAIAAATFVFARLLPVRSPKWPARQTVYHLGILIAAVLVVWAGSFEVDRYFAQPSDGAVIGVAQARQMGLSVWWALCAVALLAAGFTWRYVPGRWLALGLFGVTLGKVLLLDMSRVETGYRILSFFALGVLLVGASLLYQRYFRAAEPPAGEADAESL